MVLVLSRTSAAADTSSLASTTALATLRRPLPLLLAGGGDARLAVDPVYGSNVYGCYLAPTPRTLAFSSSTATSISNRGYRRAEDARDELLLWSGECELLEAFDARVEQMRHRLKSCLKLERAGVDVVFSPSGTDSQLHVLFFARQLLGGPLTSIVVGSDQTGSGTAYTASGRHFSDRTAQGQSVGKGTSITGRGGEVASIGIPLFAEDGTILTAGEIDSSVLEKVAEQVRMGRNVLLQTIDSSKLGWRAPSDACLQAVARRWPGRVQMVVDACQMRMGRPRLRECLSRGYIVLISGSKFFSGPAFSGASLWPKALASRIAAMSGAPDGLDYYATRFDIPVGWRAVRAALPSMPNLGQWLRWEAALEEMHAYFALPTSFRRRALARLGEAVPAALAASRHLELLAAPARSEFDGAQDAEMSNRTIFPFLVKSSGRSLDFEAMTALYRALNQDLSGALPLSASAEERALAAVACHVGQPVKLPVGTVLRIGLGASHVSEAWSAEGRTAEAKLDATVEQIRTVVRKLDLIVSTKKNLAEAS